LGAVYNQRSLIALDNLVDFIALCADRERSPPAANEVFLVCDGEEISTTELLRRVGMAYGVKTRLMPMPLQWIRTTANLMGKGDVADRLLGSLVIDASKARNFLGWMPITSMDEQLKKMAQYDALV
jgi:nucleoside-diphosphate-sugar epimerase